MNTESIIGITASIITIVGAIFGIYKLLKRLQLTRLMKDLVDKNFSTKRHRMILRIMNIMLGGFKMKKDYIQNFVLNDRGKEAVFMDMCDKNDIEPTKEFCQKLLGSDSRKAREYYNSKRDPNNTSEKIIISSDQSQTFISSMDNSVQIVYMSELLKDKYPDTCKKLIGILDKHHVKYAFIKGTNDIWCRDYMPVQIESGKLIQFKYDPSYLKGEEWDSIRSDVSEIRKKNDWLEKYTIEESDINLDGGNVLICEGRAIISDRIFEENPTIEKNVLINKLSNLLECEIIIIPALKSKEEDMTGHADGMVRFVNRNTVIGNERLPNEYKYMKEVLQNAIDKYNLTYIDIPYFEDKDREHPISALGIYVNYLEVNDLIVFPVFGREEDAQAIEIIRRVFPNKQVETINYNDVAKEGGLLNCTTWVVNSPK